jgi:hypothetical protein
MNTFELEIWDEHCEKVTFYTVRWDNAADSETDKFFFKYEKTHRKELLELNSLLLDTIGTDHGALDEFFNRIEDRVSGLPPHGKINIGEFKAHFQQFPLRLYALRINNREDIVVLFNGGIKSAETNQESPDLNLKFIEANGFGKRIEEALHEGLILIDEKSRRLTSFDGSGEIVL